MKKERNTSDGLSKLNALVRRLSFKKFTGCIYVLPTIACDVEPGAWGYPGCKWISLSWLRWTLQFSIYSYPCEHCFLFEDEDAKGPWPE